MSIEIAVLHYDLEQLKKENEKFEEENKTLKSEVNNLHDKLKAGKEYTEDLELTIKGHEIEKDDYENENSRLKVFVVIMHGLFLNEK